MDPLNYGSEGFPPRGSTWEAQRLTFEPFVKSPNIKRLWLDSNDIAELRDDDFCLLTQLWELHLSGNELTEESTPEHVFDCLDALTVLSVHYYHNTMTKKFQLCLPQSEIL